MIIKNLSFENEDGHEGIWSSGKNICSDFHIKSFSN